MFITSIHFIRPFFVMTVSKENACLAIAEEEMLLLVHEVENGEKRWRDYTGDDISWGENGGGNKIIGGSGGDNVTVELVHWNKKSKKNQILKEKKHN